MKRPSLLSATEIQTLIAGRAISEKPPWSTNDEAAIDSYYKGVCDAVSRSTTALSRIEWQHYGSGYASFVDAWFYKCSSDFNVNKPSRYGEEHVGLAVLLSRLSPYYVFIEAEQHWHPHGCSGYLPALGMVDSLQNPGVLRLSEPVQQVLASFGLIRVSRDELAEPLPPNLQVPTILTEGPYTQFDALFYWED